MSIEPTTWRRAWLDLDQMLQWVERMLLFSLLLIMLILGLVELVLVFGPTTGHGTDGALFRAVLLWMVMLSAMLATSEASFRPSNQPLRWLPEVAAGTARVPGLLISAGCCLFLAWASLRYLIVDLRLGSAGPLGSPGWVQLLILPYGFSLMSARVLARALVDPKHATAA